VISPRSRISTDLGGSSN